MSVARDRLAAGLALLEGVAALILAVAAVAYLTRGQVLYGLAFLLVVLVLALMAAIWWLRSRVEISVTDAGIRRGGRFGWELTWAEIGSADVRELGSVVGSQQALCVEPKGSLPAAVTAESRMTRSVRRSVPAGVLVLAIDPAKAEDIQAALAYRH